MNKIIPAVAGIAILGGIAFFAFTPKQQVERISHYEGQVINSTDDAFAALETNNKKIAAILKADSLSASDMEAIHEISYTLESAIDTLIQEKAGSAKILENTDEAIQAVHYSSENHDEEELREWFTRLEPAAGNIQQSAATTEETGKRSYEIVIKDHKFTPSELRVPAGEKIKLIVNNQDSTPEEFESDDFRREKIIAGNSTATISVGPLEPGKYRFFGEFNLDSANGYLIAE
jgi:plastocyanin